MEENTKKQDVLETVEAEEVAEVATDAKTEDTDAPLDKTLKLMSPTRMVVRRFFRSKLSIIGLTMVIGLFLFSFLGPVLIADRNAGQNDDFDGRWGEIELDESGTTEYASSETTYVVNGVEYTIRQTTEKN